MRIAVTGAAGYVGVNLVRRLAQAGHDVIAVDRVAPHPDATGADPAAGGRVHTVTSDVLDVAAMRAALDGCEIVYHLAAKITLAAADPVAWELNTRGVETVARASLAAGVRRMVHCSSVHSLDETRCGPTMTESSPRAIAADLPVYDRSKYAGERALAAVADDGLDTVICNPTGIFGLIDPPGQISRLNSMALDAALGRAPGSVAGGFDMVDVRDVAAGLMLAADRGRTGENYLLPGTMVSIHQLLTVAANAVGRRGPVAQVPLGVVRAILPLARPIGKALGSDVMSAASIDHLRAAPCVDGAQARRELGYAPRPFTETVRDLVAHYVRAGILADRGRDLART